MFEKEITIKRVVKSEDGVFGSLIDEDVRTKKRTTFAVTVEPEDKNNQPNISCIPAGRYECFIRRKETSRRDYDSIQLMKVPGRKAVQMHIGITEDSSDGCIIVGKSWEPYKTKSAAVMHSTKGFNELMARVKGHDTFWLNIEEHYGPCNR